MRAQSNVANFENINLKDLRVTPASLRLRKIVIGLSVGYIFIFTPVLGHFIWKYMMAEPSVRIQAVHSGTTAKPCGNRRLPSLHFALHKGGRHGTAAANSSLSPPPHGGASPEAGMPPLGKHLDFGGDLIGGHTSAANSTRVGGGTHAAPAVVARQQAAEKETAGYRMPPQTELIPAKVSGDSSSRGRVPAEGPPPPRRLMQPRQQQEQPKEPGKQPEEASGGQVEPESSSQRDYPTALPGIKQLPVRIGLQEMAAGDGREDESALDADAVRGRHHFGAGTEDEEFGARVFYSSRPQYGGIREPLLDAGDSRVATFARDGTAAKYGAEEMDFQRSVFSSNGRKGKPQLLALDDLSDQDGDGEVVNVSRDKANQNSLKVRLLSRSLSSRQRKDQTDDLVKSKSKLYPYFDRVEISEQAGHDSKRAQWSEIRNKTAAELWRLRSEKLKLKLRKQLNMAEQLKELETAEVDEFGNSRRNEPINKASRVDIGLQKELVQLTSAKKWSRKQFPPLSGAGDLTNRQEGGPIALSQQNSDEQRMIEGLPSWNKEDNEVLSFSEFFKNHLSPKQGNFKGLDSLKNVHGRRLMIDYASKKKGKEALVEGFDAGGWPEKPEEPPPTKYTLDPFHPYIARRGVGWDFYNPLKPATERNNARELAEQEFYSPEQPPVGVRRRLPRRFWAAPAVTSAPFSRMNETLVTGTQREIKQDETMPSKVNVLGRDHVAGRPPAASAAIRNALPSFRTQPEVNIEVPLQNNLSVALLGHFEVTNETVDAGSKDLAAPAGQAAKTWGSSQRLDGFQGNTSAVSLEAERPDTGRAVWTFTQNYDEEYPFGRLSRDETPRSKVSLSDAGANVNVSVKGSGGGAAEIDKYNKGADSHPEATRIVFVTEKDQKGTTRIDVATSHADLKENRGNQLRTSETIVQNSETNLASREVGSLNIPVKLDNPSTSQRAAVWKLEGNVNAAAPVAADHSVADQNEGSAFHPSNTSGRVSVDSISLQGPRSKGVMNVEPIPIESPEFNLSAEVNVANVTTLDSSTDSVSLQTGPKNYEDIVPADDRNVLSSPLHREHSGNATRLRNELGTDSSSTRMPSSRAEETSHSKRNFGPEAMNLTPPKVGLGSPIRGGFTNSRRDPSSAEPLQPGTSVMNLQTDEKDGDFYDVHNAEDTYLRIDVRTVKKLEVPTEPSNVDIGIQNKVRKATDSTVKVPAALEEIAPNGAVKIVKAKRTSLPNAYTEEQSSTQSSFKKEHLLLQTRATLRVPELTNTSGIATGTKSRYTHDSSNLMTDFTASWSDNNSRKIVEMSPAEGSNVFVFSTSTKKQLKDDSKEEPEVLFVNTDATTDIHLPEGFGSRDVSIAVPKLRSAPPASSSEPTMTTSTKGAITIEILKKKGTEHIFDASETHQRSRSTSQGVPFVRIAAKNLSRPISRDHTSSRAFSRRALVEEVTTFTIPSQKSETTTKEHSQSNAPSTKSTMRPVPFVKIAVKNSSRTTPRNYLPSSASGKKPLFEVITTFQPPSSSNGAMSRKQTESTILTEKPELEEDKSHSASPDHFIKPPTPVEDNKGLSGGETPTTRGKAPVSETTSARKYSLASSTSERHVTDVNSHPTSSEGISVGFYIRGRRHHEDGQTPTLRKVTPILEITSVQHLSSMTSPKQDTAKFSSNTHAESKVSISTMATVDKRRFIKNEIPTSDIRTMETEKISKRTATTSSSLSTTSKTTEQSTEFTRDGAIKNPKLSDRNEIDNTANFTTSKPRTPNGSTVASNSHSTLLSSSSNIPQKNHSLVTFDYATKQSKPPIPDSGASKHESAATSSTTRVRQDDKAVTSTSKGSDSSPPTSAPSRPSLIQSIATISATLPSSSETSIPETGFEEDMVGRLGDVNKMSNSTHGAKKRPEQPTAGTFASFKKSMTTSTAAKPRIEIVPLTTEKELVASMSPKPTGTEEPSLQPQETTTAAAEPTAVVFDVGDDDEEDEARLHFPMMKIKRRSSTTARRPAILDLFGRGFPTSSRPTTLRPILQHHIAVRRGRPEREPTLRPRLQHDIAMRRRRHHSKQPRPYQMTLFHDEPLQAVRIPVRRMG